jgi:hypothetical protein
MKVVPVTIKARLVKEKQMLVLPAPRLEMAMTHLNPQIRLLIGFALCWPVTADDVYFRKS